MAQQLAHLGVLDFVLIDHDEVEESNLNRLIGASPSDAQAGELKVSVAHRLITSIQPLARVVTHSECIATPGQALGLLKGVDVIFGCLDKERPRLTITDVSSTLSVPYFDLATDTGSKDERWYGGRVFVSTGDGCLHCQGEIDQDEIQSEVRSELHPDMNEKIYGVDPQHLQGTGPSVVSVNGVVASIAVTEFMALVTGLRPVQAHQRYRGDLPLLTKPSTLPTDGCPYCTRWRDGVSLWEG